ncbi:MAG: hypothetical protein HZA51_15755 [Planctomycetes bacterium]|nr:hypothetical protein [Planctomycetota bacterium]
MSLKGVHIAFIAVSLLLCAGFGAWAITDWRETGVSVSFYMGVGSFVSGIVLAVYGVWFLKKLRGISSI